MLTDTMRELLLGLALLIPLLFLVANADRKHAREEDEGRTHPIS